MRMFSNTLSVSGSKRGNVTLEEFKQLPQAESPMGELFLALLEVDWDEEMEVNGSFPPGSSHTIWIYCDLFAVRDDGWRVLTFKEEDGISTMAQVMRKVYKSLYKRTSSIKESIETLSDSHEDILKRGRQMQAKMARKFFETRDPPIKIEKEIHYERHLFFEEFGESGRIFRLYLSGHFYPAIFLVDREAYKKEMLKEFSPDKNVLLDDSERFN